MDQLENTTVKPLKELDIKVNINRPIAYATQLINEMSTVRQHIEHTHTEIGKQLLAQASDLEDIQQKIQEERDLLNRIFAIKNESISIEQLIQKQHLLRADFEKEMSQKKSEWETQKQRLEGTLADLKIKRDREESEYQYQRQLIEKQDQEKWELEIQTKKQALEKDLQREESEYQHELEKNRQKEEKEWDLQLQKRKQELELEIKKQEEAFRLELEEKKLQVEAAKDNANKILLTKIDELNATLQSKNNQIHSLSEEVEALQSKSDGFQYAKTNSASEKLPKSKVILSRKNRSYAS